jgi:DNA (cytosine-5)-methyltransferase 1
LYPRKHKEKIGGIVNGLDLFSGIGGITIALSPYVRPIAYCENDRYAQAVLLSRMADRSLPCAPIWDDVRTLNGTLLDVKPDIIYGGFPCQDISVAGSSKGMAGKRSGLFQEIVRLTEEIQPSFVFLENVPAITKRGLDNVCGAFSQLRYDCRWTIVSAAELGAPHLRKRWFMLAANTNGFRGGKEQKRKLGSESPTFAGNDGKKKSLANSMCERLERQRKKPSGVSKKFYNSSDNCWWQTEPDVGRVVNGLQHQSHRIKALGNAVVPMQAREAFMMLMGLDKPAPDGNDGEG